MIKWFKVFGWACLIMGVFATLGASGFIAQYNEAIESTNLYADYGEEQPTIHFIFSFIPFFVMAFQGCFFFAIAEGLGYLRRTAEGVEKAG
ncbi:hypothetical protein J9317_03230 [Metabacillus sp. KIGAM252]|uniref:Uncharacterized protein n=1 Tax=Metabacillus flavus TaxID=2823519 RepID=A0ABS5LAN3_9BACI|nr:hypothetical protein [Metabacillus flavus]MBS2967787.1 hypothetical protein [Metabacillus flavus]